MKKHSTAILISTSIICSGCSTPILIQSQPEGARIVINGKDFGVTPRTVTMSRSYNLLLLKDGYENYHDSISYNGPNPYNAVLTSVSGNIPISTEPQGARIFINDVDTGENTPATVNIVRSAEIKLIKDGFYKYRNTISYNHDGTYTAKLRPIFTNKEINAYRAAERKGELSCSNNCDQLFSLSQVFINEFADMKIQVATNTVVETFNPTDINNTGMTLYKIETGESKGRIQLKIKCKENGLPLTARACYQTKVSLYNNFQPFLQQLSISN